MASDASIQVEIELDDGSIIKGFQRVERQAQATGSEIDEKVPGRLKNSFSNSFSFIKENLLQIGAAFAGAFAVREVITGFVEFERAVTEVRTIVDETAFSVSQLNDLFIQQSNQFGGGAAEQANAFYQIISAGITDATEAQNTLIAANKLAIGGLSSNAQAVDILTSALNTYRQENLSAEDAADILFATVERGRTTIQDLSASFGRALPIAQNLGIGFSDTSAALAVITQTAPNTSQAVTNLRGLFAGLIRAQKTFGEKLGPEVADQLSLQAIETKGLASALKVLQEATGGSSEQLLELLGSQEALLGFQGLAINNFESLEKTTRELTEVTGAADDAFQKVNATLGNQLSRTFNIIQNAFLNLANSGAGGLGQALLGLNDILVGLVGTSEKLVSNFAGFSAAIGTLLAIKFLPPILIALRSAIIGVGAGFNFAATAARLFQASATLGLSLAIGFVVQKLVELRQQTNNLGELFEVVGLKIENTVRSAILASIVAITNAFEALPSALQRFLPSLDSLSGVVNAQNSIIVENEARIRQLTNTQTEAASSTRNLAGEIEGLQAKLTEASQFDSAGLNADLQNASSGLDSANQKVSNLTNNIQTIPDKSIPVFTALKRIGFGFSSIADNSQSARDSIVNDLGILGQSANQLGDTIRNTIGNGVVRAFSAFGAALAKGQDAFDALGKSILSTLGDLAIQIGKFIVLSSTGFSFIPGSQFSIGGIAAGTALIALGGAIKALAGQGDTGGGVGAGAGGGGINEPGGDQGLPNPEPIADAVNERQEPGTQVNVNVQGDVLDSDETGLRIADLLNKAINDQGVQVRTRTGGEALA